jgi:hypothetical protein
MGPPVSVAIPKPRTTAQLQHDDEALRVRTHVIECLTEYVKFARQRRKKAPPAPVTDVVPASRPGVMGGSPAGAAPERSAFDPLRASGRPVRLETET